MGRPYSIDLRERVVGAVIKSGVSCHQAAVQFGVGISTAILWVHLALGAISGANGGRTRWQ
jgi:putative transposase